jgi:hypothetical protein
MIRRRASTFGSAYISATSLSRAMDQGRLFSYIAPAARVPSNHPLRKIRILVRNVLGELNRSLGKLYASEGRPSIPPTSFGEEEIFDGDGHAVDKAKGEPFAQRRSHGSASASALSRATSTKALILGSSRASTVFVTSTGDSVLRRYASTSSSPSPCPPLASSQIEQ